MSVPANAIRLQEFQKNQCAPAREPSLPEPAALYALVVLTFVTHAPYVNVNTCVQCHTAWPCEQARLAYRLREGF
jgi:hypothetical protein